MARPWRAALAVTVLAAGCGGGDASEPRAPAARTPAPTSTELPARPASTAGDVAVIRHWADTLRSGDVDGATDSFAVPSVVSNGSAPVRLVTRRAVRFFNETLPCGAKLLAARRDGPYIAATFRLTDRPGADCGTGAGGTASTAFRVRDGKIAEWRRLLEAPAAPGRRS